MRGERTTPYKEDSTKGNSIINPLNYKGDVLVQVWVDSRVLATLSRWLEDHGTYTVHMSQVVRRPLEVLVDLLVNSGDATLIDSTIDARELLSRRYGVDLNRGGRGTKNIMHNMTLSMRREDIAEAAEKDKRIYDVNRPLRTNQNAAILAKVEEAKRKYKELYPDNSQTNNIQDSFSESDVSREKIVNERIVKTENAAEFVKTIRVERETHPLKEKGNSREVIEDRIRKADEESQKGLNELNSFNPLSLLSKAKKD
jgi:hypothetical protein